MRIATILGARPQFIKNRLASPTDATVLHATIAAALGSLGQNVQPYGTGSAAKQLVHFLTKGLVQ
jgi:UDP-N-acetylglucosamine 2-epimerase